MNKKGVDLLFLQFFYSVFSNLSLIMTKNQLITFLTVRHPTRMFFFFHCSKPWSSLYHKSACHFTLVSSFSNSSSSFLVFFFAYLSEKLTSFLLAAFGFRLEPIVTRNECLKVCTSHYCDITAAKEELGYRPGNYKVFLHL